MYHIDSGIKIHDIEVFPNAFLYLDIDKETKNINEFRIHESQNDLLEFVKYLKKIKGLVGYNSLSYDSQVIQFIYENVISGKWRHLSVNEITDRIHTFSKTEINKSGLGNSWGSYKEENLIVPQCDLMMIHHFKNMARIQSLKGLQCNLNYKQVQECPVSFEIFVNKEELDLSANYCKNDILSTFVLYEKTRDKIDLRRSLILQYSLPKTSINWPDPKIGEQLMLKFYCKLTNKNPWVVKKERTIREEVPLIECFPDNVVFKTEEFNIIKNIFSNTVLYYENNFKMESSPSVVYKGLQYDFGTGGLHASLTGVFESDEEYVILDVDVGSMYPNIAICNKYYPAHLGPEFIEAYHEKIVNVRMKEKAKKKEERDLAIIEGFKLAANSVYGKSNDRFSFLYDPKYTFSTTITGQLQLAMLAENIGENLSDVTIIQANTDGITVRLKKTDVSLFRDICKKWEKVTGLDLEEVEYRKMYIRDVNNYCAVPLEGKVKLKGCFEKDKELHKDPSSRIVPVALEKYIVDNIPVEETIHSHKTIWDFLLRVKFKRNMKGKFYSIKNGKECIEDAEKVARFYIAKRGKTFMKNFYRDGVKVKTSAIQKTWLVLDANLIEDDDISNYDVNHKYYIREAYKIIDAVEKYNPQLGLF